MTGVNRTVLAACVVMLAGCGEQKVSARNEFPVAMITSHADGDVVSDGDVNVLGTVTDVDDAPATLVAHWVVDGVEACPARPPDDAGISQCTVSAVDGTIDIQLLVKDPSNAVGTDRLSLEVAPTKPPTARLVLPDGSERLYTDQKVTFQGLVSDEEDGAASLEVHFESDVQPDLDIPLLIDSDGTATGFGYLDEGEHAIVMRVVDSDGKTASDSVVVRVGPPNTAPVCSITSPSDGGVVSPLEAVTLRGEVSDADQPAESLAIEWRSDVDGVLASEPATTEGETIAMSSPLSPGPHVLTLLVNDELGAACSASVVTHVGTAPTVRIDSPLGGSVLPFGDATSMQASVSDSEDALTSLVVDWSSDIDGPLGSAVADTAGVVVLPVSLSLGVHTISASTVDSHGMPATDSVDISVNDVPLVSSASIVPNPAFAGDTLSCEWEFSDATGSDASTAVWSMSGAVLGVGSSLAGPWVRGDVVRCTVTPFDGVFEGEEVSAELVVSNTVPSAVGASISPASPTTGDGLSCSEVGFVDADGDPSDSTIEWSVGGVTVGTGSEWTGPTSRGDIVTCTVTPHDGYDAGLPVSASVEIGNGIPSIASAALSPAMPTTETAISVTAVTTDPDGDPVSVTWDWTVNGLPAATATDSLAASLFERSDAVQAVGVPYDGFDYGAAVTVGPLIVENTPPAEPSVAIEPDAPTEGADPLLCTVSAAAIPDVDGDTVTYTVTWTRDGETVADAGTTTLTGDTIAASSTTAGEVWICEAVPSDGTADGPSGDASVVIGSAQTRVFVTSEGYSTGFGGPFGADAACTDAAESAGLGGTWTAFISGGGATAISRIADGPYVRLDGELIAEDRADLADGSILAPINLTELDGAYSGFVCTGSSASGTATGGSTASGGNCAGWTRDCGVCFGNHWYVTVGHTGYTNDDWVDRGWNFCGSCRLYCFED